MGYVEINYVGFIPLRGSVADLPSIETGWPGRMSGVIHLEAVHYIEIIALCMFTCSLPRKEQPC